MRHLAAFLLVVISLVGFSGIALAQTEGPDHQCHLGAPPNQYSCTPGVLWSQLVVIYCYDGSRLQYVNYFRCNATGDGWEWVYENTPVCPGEQG